VTAAAAWALPSYLDALPAQARVEILGLYRKGLLEQVASLEAALACGAELPLVVSVAHKIAGSAGMMQDPGLAELARRLEESLLQGADSGALELARRLAAHARMAADIVDQALG
jgi:HPt (histidine-containing phosphotransfer) domain-containing protein